MAHGTFKNYPSNLHIYQFGNTVSASKAKITDFIALSKVETDKILPPIPKSYVDIDLCVVVLPHKKIMKLDREHKKLDREHKKLDREHKKLDREHKKLDREHKKLDREHKKLNREHKKVFQLLSQKQYNEAFKLLEGSVAANETVDTENTVDAENTVDTDDSLDPDLSLDALILLSLSHKCPYYLLP